MNNLTNEKILKNLKFFKNDCKPLERYASFDYCFNYFQRVKDKDDKSELTENMQHSCLQLGFYLASWGMYRGSTFLLQKSAKVFKDLIEYIASPECDVWYIDVHDYSDSENISKLIACEERIREKLGKHDIEKADGTILKDREATLTLTTKIMLGVFGNVPAFDNYFRSGSKLGTFNELSLNKIKKFFDDHQKTISNEVKKTKTLEYNSGVKGDRNYTKAKIIDMIFFAEGLEISKGKNKKTNL